MNKPTAFRSHANRNTLIRTVMAVIPPHTHEAMAPIVARITDAHMREDYTRLASSSSTLTDINKICLSRISTDLKEYMLHQAQQPPKKTLVILEDADEDVAPTNGLPPMSTTSEKMSNEEISERIAMELKMRRLELPVVAPAVEPAVEEEKIQSRVTWASPIENSDSQTILQLESRISALEEQVRVLISAASHGDDVSSK